jgi:signal transduction histidine kinase
MIFQRLHHRLIAAMTGLIIILLGTVGLTLHWSIRQSLEKALGEKLESVAATLSSQYTSEEVSLMIEEMGPRLKLYFMQPLTGMLESADLKRVYIFTLDYRSLLDTDTTAGPVYHQLQFFNEMMRRLRSGETSHTPLFTDIEGIPVMSGFAPIRLNETVIGGVGVDGNVRFLNAVKRLNHQMILFGTLGTIIAVILATLISRTLTQPIAALSRVSQQIGAGHYHTKVPQSGPKEIGQLAYAMEIMRQNVIRREKELKTMVAAVAHEIRNPLGGITLFTDLLTDELPKDHPAIMHLNRIRSEIGYLNEIVHRFMEFAKPETPQPENCRPCRIVRELYDTLKPELHRADQLDVSDCDETIQLRTDPNHLKRIFLNLLQNSLHAITESGQVQIRILQKRGDCLIQIEDNGSGIPPEIQEEIFDPFFTTREKGTGLGLAIVKQLTEANGGKVNLIRSDQNGTLFELRFPLGE